MLSVVSLATKRCDACCRVILHTPARTVVRRVRSVQLGQSGVHRPLPRPQLGKPAEAEAAEAEVALAKTPARACAFVLVLMLSHCPVLRCWFKIRRRISIGSPSFRLHQLFSALRSADVAAGPARNWTAQE